MAGSSLSYISNLDVNVRPAFTRLSGIVCTIGPSSQNVQILEEMMAAGMNIARLNFSHGTHEYHETTIRNVREAAKSYGEKIGMAYPVAIAMDTKGAEIRTGLFKNQQVSIQLEKNDEIQLCIEEKWRLNGSKSILFVDYPGIIQAVQLGTRVFIDDGFISLVCVASDGISYILCRVENGGTLGTSKSVSLAQTVDTHLPNRPVLSERDLSDIKFGLEHGIDMILVSFTNSAENIQQVRNVLGDSNNNNNTLVVAKVESRSGMENVDEIISLADGILMDRGDLGMEIGLQKVFLAQKVVIAKCNMAGKPIVMATQMLESMVKHPRPTRAESSDVANAVLDGADCVMLSGETANGAYPIEAVKVMAAACVQAEAVIWQRRLFSDLTEKIEPPIDVTHATAIAAVHAASLSTSTAIIVITKTGKSAQMISRYRPRCPIVAVTRNDRVARQLHLYRAILPVFYQGTLVAGDWEENVRVRIRAGIEFGKARSFIKVDDTVVVVTGWKQGAGSTNTLSTMIVQ